MALTVSGKGMWLLFSSRGEAAVRLNFTWGCVRVRTKALSICVCVRAGHAQPGPVRMLLGRGGTGAQSLVYSVGLKCAAAVCEMQEENKTF